MGAEQETKISEDLSARLHRITMDTAGELGVDILDPEAVEPVIKAVVIFEGKFLRDKHPITTTFLPIILKRSIREEVARNKASTPISP